MHGHLQTPHGGVQAAVSLTHSILSTSVHTKTRFSTSGWLTFQAEKAKIPDLNAGKVTGIPKTLS